MMVNNFKKRWIILLMQEHEYLISTVFVIIKNLWCLIWINKKREQVKNSTNLHGSHFYLLTYIHMYILCIYIYLFHLEEVFVCEICCQLNASRKHYICMCIFMGHNILTESFVRCNYYCIAESQTCFHDWNNSSWDSRRVIGGK